MEDPKSIHKKEYYLAKRITLPWNTRTAPKIDKRIQGENDGSDLVTVMTTRLVLEGLNF